MGNFVRQLGVPEDMLFSSVDLIEQKNKEKVVNCIYYVIVNHAPVKIVPKRDSNEINLKFFWFPKLGEWVVLPLIAGTALG